MLPYEECYQPLEDLSVSVTEKIYHCLGRKLHFPWLFAFFVFSLVVSNAYSTLSDYQHSWFSLVSSPCSIHQHSSFLVEYLLRAHQSSFLVVVLEIGIFLRLIYLDPLKITTMIMWFWKEDALKTWQLVRK